VISERTGRLPTIFIGLFIQLVSFLLYFIEDYDVLLVARFVSGLAGGLSSTICGPYSEEIVPDSYKNLSKILFYVFVASASTISYLIGLFFGDSVVDYWQWALLAPLPITIIRSLLFLTVFRLESPRYIMSKHCENNQIKHEANARKRIRNILRK